MRSKGKISASKQTEYEKCRMLTIEQNALKFQQLGLARLANQLRERTGVFQEKDKEINENSEEDPEYMPEEELNDDALIEGRGHPDESANADFTSNHASNKVDMMISARRVTRSKKKASCPSMPISEFLKGHESTHTLQENENIDQVDTGHMLSLEHNSGFEEEIEEGDDGTTDNTKRSNTKRSRGPTLLPDVHARTLEDRVPVFFNELGQPIGPSDEVCGEFSKFLGTIAHEHSWAPLIYTSWHEVPNKDKMWEYVNCKYILPQTKSVKKWVLNTISCAWRLFKSRLKSKHYTAYKSDLERWKKRPGRIPDSHFRLLLKYWKTSPVKELSARNAKHHGLLDNMHTTGPVSFARIQHKMAERDGQPPSRRMLFEETRKRNSKREYKESYDDTFDKIERMKDLAVLQEAGLSIDDEDPFDQVMHTKKRKKVLLYGRGVSMKNLKKTDEEKGDAPSVVIPQQYIDALKLSLAVEMQKDLEAQKEKMALDMKQEFEAQKEKMALEVQQEKMALEAQKDKLANDVVERALAQLQKLLPNMTTEILGQVVASSLLAK